MKLFEKTIIFSLFLVILFLMVMPVTADDEHLHTIIVLDDSITFQLHDSSDFGIQGYYLVPVSNPHRQDNPIFRWVPEYRAFTLDNEHILKEDILSKKPLIVYGYGLAKSGRYAGKMLVTQLNSPVVIHRNDTFSVVKNVYDTNRLACTVTQNNRTTDTAYSLGNFTVAPTYVFTGSSHYEYTVTLQGVTLNFSIYPYYLNPYDHDPGNQDTYIWFSTNDVSRKNGKNGNAIFRFDRSTKMLLVIDPAIIVDDIFQGNSMMINLDAFNSLRDATWRGHEVWLDGDHPDTASWRHVLQSGTTHFIKISCWNWKGTENGERFEHSCCDPVTRFQS